MYDVTTVGKDTDFDGVLPLKNNDVEAGFVKVHVKWFPSSMAILQSKGVTSITAMKPSEVEAFYKNLKEKNEAEKKV